MTSVVEHAALRIRSTAPRAPTRIGSGPRLRFLETVSATARDRAASLARASVSASRRHTLAFTLVEVMAALLLMAIIIPVAMEGMSVASRAGVLGQRKATALRVAERLLNELIVEGQTQQTSGSGTLLDGDTRFPWTMRTEPWSEDAMQRMTVTVTFTVQGNAYEVSASTLLPPSSTEPAAGTSQ